MRGLTLILIMAMSLGAASQEKKLDYSVKYKLGPIEHTVGKVNLKMNVANDQLWGTLTGKSIPWGGRIYSIADTLNAYIGDNSEKITYINGYYRKPYASASADSNGQEHYRTIMGQGTLSASPETMEAVEVTANLIGSLYFIDRIDFSEVSPGDKVGVSIESAQDGLDNAQICYQGESTFLYDGEHHDVYKISIDYEKDGYKIPYCVECYILKESRLPVYLGAQIKIGHIMMTLVP